MTRREKFREDLNRLYLPLYNDLCTLLPPRWQPYCGVRSFPDQKRLYDQGRTKPGKKVTDASPGTSPHNYGCASDWTLFDAYGKPIWLDADDPSWKEYSDACFHVGARWGIKISVGIDSPHNELPLSVKWSDVYDHYILDGMPKALLFIEKHRVIL